MTMSLLLSGTVDLRPTDTSYRPPTDTTDNIPPYVAQFTLPYVNTVSGVLALTCILQPVHQSMSLLGKAMLNA